MPDSPGNDARNGGPPPKHPAMFVPAGNGVIIPKSANELMKMIQAQKKRDKKSAEGKDARSSASGPSNSANKQEQQSELLETKLMELEDYTCKPEGVHRLLRTFEIITM